MKIQRLVLAIVIILSLTPKITANIDTLDEVMDFGSFTAPVKVSKTVNLNLLIGDKSANYFYVWIDEEFISKENNRILPVDRFELEIGQDVWELSSNPTFVQLEHEQDNQDTSYEIPVSLTYTVFPSDLPGIYETKLCISEEVGYEEVQIPIRMEVLPWIVMELNIEGLNINQWNTNCTRLYNGIPGKLRIASNSEWELYAALGDGAVLPADSLEITMTTNSGGHFYGLYSSGVFLSEDDTLLGRGLPTVQNDNYWTEVPFNLAIEDFTAIPAGKLQIPFVFVTHVLKE